MKAVLASHNKNKIKELEALIKKYIPDFELLSLDDVGTTDEIEENGKTFAENALIKAKVAARSGYIGIGDDSGLMVHALGGMPGVYSARYAGEHGNDKANNEKLLLELGESVDRGAMFVCVIACVFPNGDEPVIAQGICNGEILPSPRGEDGFGYDPLFWFDPYGMTFAEMKADEKNEISHRGNAVRAIAAELIRKINTQK